VNRCLLVAAALALIASGCSSAPGGGDSALPVHAAAVHPADSASGLPGDSATGLPGDSATGLPGASFACSPVPQNGEASCTIAINVNIAPTGNPNAPASSLPGYHPADLIAAYNLPAQNAGGTVAIVDAYDDPAAEADLGVYRATFGLPACTSGNGCFSKLNESGQSANYPAENTSWAQEIALDLDMVSAACPNCRIVLVEANSASIDDLGASVDTAAALHPLAISNSYYAAEWNGETAEDTHYRHPGVAITVSAGDQPSPFYPAASPYVTSVGGTSLSLSSGRSEVAWAYGGRGCSAYEAKPSWQASTGCSMRSTVDVAAVADPQTGVAMFDSLSGGWLVAGGTSVGSPLLAASYALAANPQSAAYSYAHAGSFYDIGSAGYAAATGLGSPDGVGGL
jgi:subtilase family serine protease